MQELISVSTHEIKCARCDVALKGPANPQGHDRIACPQCGTGDTFDRVMDEIKEQLAVAASDAFGRGLESAIRGSKNMKLTKTPRPEKTYRFVADFHL
jgi:hypothetical protein